MCGQCSEDPLSFDNEDDDGCGCYDVPLLDDLYPLVPVDTAERLPDGRTVIRPSNSPCRKHGIRSCPKCGR